MSEEGVKRAIRRAEDGRLAVAVQRLHAERVHGGRQELVNAPHGAHASAISQYDKNRLAEKAKKLVERQIDAGRFSHIAEETRLTEIIMIAERARMNIKERIADISRTEENARLAVEKRIAEIARIAEEGRIVEEAKLVKIAKEAEKARCVEIARVVRINMRERIANIVRTAGNARLAVEARLAEIARVAEESRIVEEAHLAEIARVAEEDRIAEEANLVKIAKEAEEARRVEIARIAQLMKEERLSKEKANIYDAIVLCGGKCGGTALTLALKESGYSTAHFHKNNVKGLIPSNIEITPTFTLYDAINNIPKSHLIYIVDSYRTPIERKISSFFQNISLTTPNYQTLSVEDLILIFNQEYLSTLEEYHPIDDIMKHCDVPTFTEFDFAKSYNIARKDNLVFIKILFKDVKKWGAILADIMDKSIVIQEKNINTNSLYKAFLKIYRVDRSYLQTTLQRDTMFKIYNTKEEQKEYIDRWMNRSYITFAS
jgi:hypothetical protein